MRGALPLILDLLIAISKLMRSGGARSIVAEKLLLKQQLIIHSRSRQRSPNLTTSDRALLSFLSLFLSPHRIARAAIIIRPSTLLSCHNALKKRNYQKLYSPRGSSKPGTKGPSKEIISAIVEMKKRNPRYGCPRIAQRVNLAFGLDLFRCASILLKSHWVLVVMDQYTRRIIGFAFHNIKSLPHLPMSHPFVERLVGSIRRELLDQTFFWTATDLENKLRDYQDYYNKHRCHSSRNGALPIPSVSADFIHISSYCWEKHCRGLFQLAVAA